MESARLHTLDVNEQITTEHGTIITRVPNGWIYTFNNHSIFIEYSSEFKYDIVRKLKFSEIESVVIKYFDLPGKFYYRKTKKCGYPLAKMIIAFIAFHFGTYTQEELRQKLRYRDRSAIAYAAKMIPTYYENDKKIQKQIDDIKKTLNINE
jgi:chromosomal replication initiation ATPase DnaA